MGLRIQAYLIGAVVALVHSSASALGLGEIKLNSALNQPLDAEIALLQVRDLSEREIIAGLATPKDFERLGVDRPFFLLDMKFDVDLKNASGPILRISSKKPVKEPFLNFIVQAQWPSGKLLREYTVLVDLPIFSGAQAEPASPVQTSRPSPSVNTNPNNSTSSPRATSSNLTVPERGDRPVSRPRVSEPSFNGSEYGPVKSNDNLWDIARRVRPDSSVTVQQTMLAIQRLNPDAFINNNINLIRRGQVLRVPSRDEIAQTSSQQAVRQVAAQNRQFANRDYSSNAQLEGSKNIAPTTTSTNTIEGRVKLSGDDSDSSGNGLGGGGEGAAVGKLEDKLAVTQEELDATSRENSELRARIRAMEEQIQTMEKLMEVSSEEMRALELAAKQLNDQKANEEQAAAEAQVEGSDGEAAEPATGAEEQVTESGSPSELNAENDAEVATAEDITESVDEAANDAEQSSSVAEQAANPEVKPEVKPETKPAVVAPAKPAKKGIVDLLMENIVYVGAGLGGLIILIAGFLFMRNRDDGFSDEDFEDLDNDFSFEEPSAEVDSDEAEFAESEAYEEQDDDTQIIDEQPSAPAAAETEDVVAECDIHLAYAQYEQAEEKLLTALNSEPDNAAVRLKLLEVYAAQESLVQFDAELAKLKASGDASAIARAESMREGFEGAPPFDESAVSDLELQIPEGDDTVLDFNEEESVAEDFDLNDDKLDFDFDSVDELVSSSDQDEAVLDLAEDLDDTVVAQDEELSLELDSDEDITVTPETNEIDLDFDLDDQDLDLDLEDVDLELDLEEGSFELDDGEAASLELTDESSETLDLSSTEDDTVVPELDAADLSEDLTEDAASLEFEASDFELEGLDSDLSDTAENELVDMNLEEGDFDGLDLGDLDSDQQVSEVVEEAAKEDSSDELEDFDLGGLDSGELDLDSEEFDLASDDLGADLDESPVQAADGDLSAELADEADLSVDDFNELDAPVVEDELSAEGSSELESGPDFDSEVDLESDVNLDALDQELDALAGDLEGDLTSHETDTSDLDSAMEEPVLDFDEDEVAPLVSEPLPEDFDLEDEAAFDGVGEFDLGDAPELSKQDLELAEELDLGDAEPLSEEAKESAQSNDESVVEGEELSSDSDMDITQEYEIPDFDPEEDDDSSLGFLSDSDETATKLDLARAYIDMGDADGAKDILDEIMDEGNDDQKKEAEVLLGRLA